MRYFFNIISLSFVLFAGCFSQSGESVEFFIPEGPAGESLKAFADQAKVEIIFRNHSIDEVVTKPISGKKHPQKALEQMLVDTGLSFYRDKHSQSYAVFWTSSESPILESHPDP